jgi:hypothetical protein
MTKFLIPSGLLDEMISTKLSPTFLSGLNTWVQAALMQEPASPTTPNERGQLTRWLGYAFGNPRITRDAALALLPLQPGEPNPYFTILDAISRESGDYVTPDENAETLATVGPVTRLIWQLPVYGVAIVMGRGDVIDMPVWFEIDSPSLTCPFSTTGEIWNDWGTYGESHKPQQFGTKWYRSNAVGASGELMRASQWVPYVLQGLIKPISLEAFLEIQRVNSPSNS